MTDYTITTNFGAKDSLPSGNAGKVIKGSEFTTEFTNIQTAVNTKADTAGDTFTGVVNFSADVAFDTNTLFVDVSTNRVGMGTTSPAGNLHISAGASGDATLILEADTDNVGSEEDNPRLEFRQDNNLVQGSMYLEGTEGTTANGSISNALVIDAKDENGSDIQFATGGTTGDNPTNSTVRATITDLGNVGIGTTSPNKKLHVKDGDIRIESTYPRLYLTDTDNNSDYSIINNNGDFRIYDDTEAANRMAIDSSGNVLVGTTNSAHYTTSTTSGHTLFANGVSAHSADGGSVGIFNRRTSDGTIADFRKDGTTVGSISVTSSATSYNTSSDERLKENITDSADAGSKVDAIQIRQFDWKADGSHQDYGVIAQELINVAPEAVSEGDTEEDMMGVDYSKLVPMLIKEIQSLRSRVAELENV